jgi:hypothetical protein
VATERASLSFHPPELEAFIADGRAAWAEVRRGLLAAQEPSPRAKVKFGEDQPVDEGIARLIASTPPEDAQLGLRELMILGVHSEAGELQRPLAEPLREWFGPVEGELGEFFPEITPSVPLHAATPLAVAPEKVLPVVAQRGEAVAFARGLIPTPASALFVLLRDWALELAPVLAEADGDVDVIVRLARGDLERTGVVPADWESRLAEVEPGAQALLVALLTLFPSEVRSQVDFGRLTTMEPARPRAAALDLHTGRCRTSPRPRTTSDSGR